MKKTDAGKARPFEIVTKKLRLTSIDGGDTMAHCPAHDDQRESLHVTELEDGTVLLRCHAGCENEGIVRKLGLTMADLFPKKGKQIYVYHDAEGKRVYRVVRRSGKQFHQERREDKQWIAGMKGVDRVLYRLPWLKDRHVYVVEGEKDANRLWALGIAATTSVGGAGSWKSEYAEQLRDIGVKDVTVLRDNDDAGLEYQQDVARSCFAVGLQVRCVELSDVDDKEDVSDWLDKGHTKDDLAKIVKATPVYDAEADTDDGNEDSGRSLAVPDDGYIGLAAEYAEIIAKLTETPKAFAYFAFLAHIGATLSPLLEYDSSTKYPARLYVVFLATTAGKKSTAMRQAREFFRDQKRGVWPHGVIPYALLRGISSAQGLGQVLQGQDEDDEGLLFDVDELEGLVQNFEMKASPLLSGLLSLFDDNQWQLRIKDGGTSINVKNAHLSVLTATTFAVWDTIWPAKAIDQGLCQRFWFVPAEPIHRIPMSARYPKEYYALIEKTRAVLKEIRAADVEKPVLVRLSKKADALYQKWHAEEFAIQDLTAEGHRLDGILIRLAEILAVTNDEFDGETVTISGDVMRAALALVRWQYEARKRNWPLRHEDKAGRIQGRISRALESAGAAGLSRRDLQRRTKAGQGSFEQWDRVIGYMVRENRVRVEKGKREDGRAGLRYFFAAKI